MSERGGVIPDPDSRLVAAARTAAAAARTAAAAGDELVAAGYRRLAVLLAAPGEVNAANETRRCVRSKPPGEPFSAVDIATEIALFHAVDPGRIIDAVRAELGRLAAGGEVVRPARGVYAYTG